MLVGFLIKKMKIFLDDVREPKDCLGYMYKRIGTLNPIYLKDWIIVRNYNDFVKVITENAIQITHISFDHDLGEDIAVTNREKGLSKRAARKIKKFSKSGYDCAVWLNNYYKDNDLKLPMTMFVHSQNIEGGNKILSIFT